MNRLALFISVIFHPIWVNLYALLALVYFHPFLYAGLSLPVKGFYIAFIFIACSVLPLLLVLLQKLFGFTKTIMLTEAEDRHVPYIFTASMYLFTYYLFKKMAAPTALLSFLLAQSAIVVAILVINFKTKISAHATSFGAIIGLVIGLAKASYFDLRWILVMLFLLAGVTLSARLQLKAHNLNQIYIGFLVGLLLMVLLVY